MLEIGKLFGTMLRSPLSVVGDDSVLDNDNDADADDMIGRTTVSTSCLARRTSGWEIAMPWYDQSSKGKSGVQSEKSVPDKPDPTSSSFSLLLLLLLLLLLPLVPLIDFVDEDEVGAAL